MSGETNYASEHDMNLSIRRAKALEAMQEEYDRKAREFEERKAKQRQLDAEEQARRVAAAPASSSTGGPGGNAGGGGGGPKGSPDWTPLMGSGPVGGFKSGRCNPRRGG